MEGVVLESVTQRLHVLLIVLGYRDVGLGAMGSNRDTTGAASRDRAYPDMQ
jgi:hypothetical protein